MSRGFSAEFWDQTWRGGHGGSAMKAMPPHPRVLSETADLKPGTALDVGCGAGTEALALAQAGWEATGVDISEQALEHAAQRAQAAGLDQQVRWQVADAVTWEPEQRYDLVLSCYAHAPIPQEDLYARLADWVAPGGRLLLIGHLHHHADRPEEASTTPEQAAAGFGAADWEIITTKEEIRIVQKPDGAGVVLRDVILHLLRR
ncbi:SAM-dependent methyltransferase [Nesterenkonia cremea]|uniref:Methyltransferase n=1 Tax=Nesterenkonia cremea TaxID=1882340 RepID=A0A917AUZ1_9MICC|nr:class I SAM-dependent methyltransferase [Nesterenkonia cremea]GGE77784.1 methyltransferase [Nesterenkonia cremea]